MSKKSKKADKKELEKWIKDNDLSFVKSKVLDSLGTGSLSDLTILTEDDIRSVNAFKPVELRKFMNAIEAYKNSVPDNKPSNEPVEKPTKDKGKDKGKDKQASKEKKGSLKDTASKEGKGKARAKFAWTATTDDQLTCAEGEIMTILDNSRRWWKMRNSRGDEGDVPSNYMELVEDDATDKKTAKKSTTSLGSSNKPDLPDEKEEDIYAPVDRGAADEPDYEDPDDVDTNSKGAKSHWERSATVKVVPDTEPLGSDPLEWMNGEVIRWLKEKDLDDFKDVFYANGFDGATLVTLSAQSFKLGGFDPVRCDKLQEALDELADPIIGKAKALYSYQASKPTQLSFKEGDILQVIDDKGSWWKAKKTDGQKGMVPSNYIEMLPKEKSSRSSSSEDSIENAPWYCNKDRKQAEAILRSPGHKTGDFLIRPSRTNPGDHTLTALGPSGIMNLKIQEQKPGVFVLGQFSSQFSSISKLVEHHGRQEIRITGKEPVLLVRPIKE